MTHNQMNETMTSGLAGKAAQGGTLGTARYGLGAMLAVALLLGPANGVAAQVDTCVGDACADLRPVLNPPFPTPTGMFFPEMQMRAAQAPAPQQRQAQVQLASMTVAGAGRMPMMRPGFVPVQQRGPAPAQAQAPARPAPAPASDARPPEPDRRGIDSWFAECPQGQATGCRVLRRAPGADGSPGVTVIVAADPRSPGRNQATVVLPLGISVRESIPMLLDDRFVALLPIETCLPAGCVLNVALSPPMIAALRTTTTLKLLAPTPNGQTIPFVVPVSGFGDAYQKVAG